MVYLFCLVVSDVLRWSQVSKSAESSLWKLAVIIVSGAVARWRGGAVARWRGGAVARWRGGAVARWRGGAVARWRGGAVARCRGGAVARWRGGARARDSDSRLRESCAAVSDFEQVCSLYIAPVHSTV